MYLSICMYSASFVCVGKICLEYIWKVMIWCTCLFMFIPRFLETRALHWSKLHCSAGDTVTLFFFAALHGWAVSSRQVENARKLLLH